jgi:hypothetical protein
VYSYNEKEDSYSLYWVDSMGSPPEVFTGGFTGNVLVLGHAGPPMHVRLTWDLTNEGRIESKMEMSSDGVEWRMLFDASYRRS